MIFLKVIQQTGQMSGHMTNSSGNQDTILIITIVLGLIILLLVGLLITAVYLFYTGRISFSRKKTMVNDLVQNSESDANSTSSIQDLELPPISLTPLERKIVEVVLTGHNVLQSELPGLVKSSKSKVSEALSQLEEKKVIQRFKAGRSLTIQYTYQNTS